MSANTSTTALRIDVDGTVTDVDLSGDDSARLRALQGAVGGYIERVPLRGDVDMWVWEEALLQPGPPAFNRTASAVLAAVGGTDPIVGPAVIAGVRGSNVVGCPADFAEFVRQTIAGASS